MAATASTLSDLHLLHQRAKALRDRMTSAPKTLAAREAAATKRQGDLDAAKKALQEAKAKLKNREVQVQALNGKIDDLRVKLNTVRKNEEYKALQNQIAHDKAAIAKIEDEMLESMSSVEDQAAEVGKMDAEIKAFAAEVGTLKAQILAQAEEQRIQLVGLETAIVEAEECIPADDRDRYRRTVKQKGPDALAAIESGACTNCYLEVTHQMINELIINAGITYCKSCGCILYITEQNMPNTRRKTAKA